MHKLGSCVSTTVGFIFLALLLALLVGPAIFVEVSGVNTPGVVVARREQISVQAATWNRQLLIEVRNSSLQTIGDEETAAERGALIAVEPELYDKLRVGDAVELRYLALPILNGLPNNGFARLTQQPPLGGLLASARSLAPYVIGIALWLALLLLWSKWRSGWLAALIFMFMVGAGLYLGSGWPPPEPGGLRAATTATVRATHRVDQVWGGRQTQAEDAVQPYDIVELEFEPSGVAGPVVAVDLVDAGSVPGLAEGVRLPIHYSVENHRWAQLDMASRTYYWKNMRSFGIIAVIGVVLLLGVWLLRRRHKRVSAGKPDFPTTP